jgi:peptidoglycan/LPS O-acetylase OafA/YrhL
VNWPHAFSSFVYLSNYFNAICGDPNTAFSHTWSLAIEEQFYLIWPVVLLLLWRRPERALGRSVMALGVLWALRLVLVLVFQVPQSYIYASFETRADALLVGCIAAMAIGVPGIARALDSFAKRSIVPVLATIAFLVVSAAELRYGTFFRDTVSLLLLPFVFVAIILHVTAVSNGPVTRFLEIPIMRYMGRISYAMYLYQQIAVDPMRRLTAELPFVVQVAAVFVVVILLATASYYVVERPFLRLKDRFATVRTPKVDHPATAPA